MKILIINGYSKTYECAKCFAEYESLIREVTKSSFTISVFQRYERNDRYRNRILN